MCIIIAANSPDKITPELIERCWNRNSDGAGFAYVADDRIKVVKELSNLKLFKKLYSKHSKIAIENQSPMLIHFRIGTSGTKTIHNVHPFYVNEDIVMCHNGVLSNIKVQDNRSDTNTFCFYVLRRLGRLAIDPTIQFLIRGFIGTGNKLAFLTREKKIIITNESAGEKSEEFDAWFSNSGYKEPVVTYNNNVSRLGYGRGANLGATIMVKCEICEESAAVRYSDFWLDGLGNVICDSCGKQIEKLTQRLRKEALEDTQEVPRDLILPIAG